MRSSSRSGLIELLVCRLMGFLVMGMFLPGWGLAQENHAPGAPGEIAISEITAHSARVAWQAASDADGDALTYLVSLRQRIEGVAQRWSAPRETRGLFLVWDGLAAAAVYDVKVAASDGRVVGPERIRENAFTTLREVEGNRPPTAPARMEISSVGAHSARIAWSASTDPDLDAITYSVSVRKRVDGVASDWLAARTTSATALVWDGLEAETTYDVRIRASDGKSVSAWLLRESAFRTTAESNAPTRPTELTISAVTATSARVTWVAATGPSGVQLVYQVQVRARLEGVPQAWRQVAETTGLTVLVTGLSPKTVYDVQVRAVAQGVAGAWTIKERAFTTLAETEVNHPPGRPGPLRVSDLTPRSARLTWGPATDLDGDPLTYGVCLRTRIAGVAQPWSSPRETERLTLAWDGLTPGTVYEVRIRAWDGKAFSDWYIKEQAFETPTVNRLTSFASLGDPTQTEGQGTLLLVWPAALGALGLETSDTLGAWSRCLEIETDGSQFQAQVPMDTDARFFRLR